MFDSCCPCPWSIDPVTWYVVFRIFSLVPQLVPANFLIMFSFSLSIVCAFWICCFHVILLSHNYDSQVCLLVFSVVAPNFTFPVYYFVESEKRVDVVSNVVCNLWQLMCTRGWCHLPIQTLTPSLVVLPQDHWRSVWRVWVTEHPLVRHHGASGPSDYCNHPPTLWPVECEVMTWSSGTCWILWAYYFIGV